MSICVLSWGSSKDIHLFPLVTHSLGICHIGSAHLSKQSRRLVLPGGQTAADGSIWACGRVGCPWAGGLAVQGRRGCGAPQAVPLAEDRWTGLLLAPSPGDAAGCAPGLPIRSGFWSILLPVGTEARRSVSLPGGAAGWSWGLCPLRPCCARSALTPGPGAARWTGETSAELSASVPGSKADAGLCPSFRLCSVSVPRPPTLWRQWAGPRGSGRGRAAAGGAAAAVGGAAS